LTPVRTYNCFKNQDRFETLWAEDKRDWCCQKHHIGCDKFNCNRGDPKDDWCEERKVWCCEQYQKGCEWVTKPQEKDTHPQKKNTSASAERVQIVEVHVEVIDEPDQKTQNISSAAKTEHNATAEEGGRAKVSLEIAKKMSSNAAVHVAVSQNGFARQAVLVGAVATAVAALGLIVRSTVRHSSRTSRAEHEWLRSSGDDCELLMPQA